MQFVLPHIYPSVQYEVYSQEPQLTVEPLSGLNLLCDGRQECLTSKVVVSVAIFKFVCFIGNAKITHTFSFKHIVISLDKISHNFSLRTTRTMQLAEPNMTNQKFSSDLCIYCSDYLQTIFMLTHRSHFSVCVCVCFAHCSCVLCFQSRCWPVCLRW